MRGRERGRGEPGQVEGQVGEGEAARKKSLVHDKGRGNLRKEKKKRFKNICGRNAEATLQRKRKKWSKDMKSEVNINE